MVSLPTELCPHAFTALPTNVKKQVAREVVTWTMLTTEEDSAFTHASMVPGLLSCHASTSWLPFFTPELICGAVIKFGTWKNLKTFDWLK